MTDTHEANRPSGHNTINPFVAVADARGFIDFVVEVFGGKETVEVRTPDRDGKLIHAEVVVGNSTVMMCDSKDDWSFTPALLQIYTENSESTLKKATDAGGTIITPTSSFYGGYTLARILDPWRNLWWIYAPGTEPVSGQEVRKAETNWHDEDPRFVYTSLMETMRTLSES